MASLGNPLPGTSKLAASAVLGVALVLLIHRYGGIDHDAMLYLGQGLAKRWPSIYGHDLFFVHGSQGLYTVLPWLIGQALRVVDPVPLFMWGGLAGLLAFCLAGWYCLAGLLPENQRYWAWLGVACLPSTYGRSVIFSYNEAFLTPRPLAEAACLLGIGLLVRGHRSGALACAVVALLLHPLQSIAAFLVCWTWLVLQDRRWLHAAWALVPIGILAVAGTPPLDGLVRSYDADWLAMLRQTSGQLFLTGWPASDQIRLAFDGMLLVLAWRTLPRLFGAWCACACLALAVALAASFILVDWQHLVLPAGLQLWRVHWLAHWLAMAVLGALLARDVAAGDLARTLALALAAVLSWGTAVWTWIPLLLLYLCWPALTRRTSPRFARTLGWLCALGLLALFAGYAANELASFRAARHRLDLYPIDQRILLFPAVALGIPVIGMVLWKQARSAALRAMLLACAWGMLVWGGVRWDARTPVRVALEDNAYNESIFGVRLPEQAQVYWGDMGLAGTWVILRRADYFDPQQLSGIPFNRATTMAARARIARMEPLIMEGQRCQATLSGTGEQACRIDERALLLACKPGSPAPPDFLAMPFRLPRPALGTWAIRAPDTGIPLLRYFLYDCSQVLAAGPSAARSTSALFLEQGLAPGPMRATAALR